MIKFYKRKSITLRLLKQILCGLLISHVHSFPVYIAPIGIPENFRVTAGEREAVFSWSPPTVSAPISNYTLYCYPSPDSFPLTLPTAGSHRLSGFSPATEYRCSLVANYNSTVSGVPANIDFTTLPDRK